MSNGPVSRNPVSQSPVSQAAASRGPVSQGLPVSPLGPHGPSAGWSPAVPALAE